MMNKGLEVIEAHWLFGAPREQIEVVIHPQSVIHSLVEYVDGSVLAQLGHPDMRTPIAQALAYPERIDAGVGMLDLAALGALVVRGAGLRPLSLPRARLRRAARRRHRAGGRSTPPTKSRSPRSSPAASATLTSPPRARETLAARRGAAGAHAGRRARRRRRGPGVRPRVAEAAGRGSHCRRTDGCRLMDILQKILAFLRRAVRAGGHPRARATTRSRAGAASRCCAFRSASAASLWSRRYGADRTEWAISAVPLGGYVKMADEREGDLAPADLPRAFNRQGVGKRIAIVAAGPIANLLLAVLLFAGTFVAGVPGQRALLGRPAARHAGGARRDARRRPGGRGRRRARCEAGRTCAGGC